MVDFGSLFSSVRNHRWLFTLTVLLIIVGVAAGVQIRPPSYESAAKLLVNLDRMNVSASRAEIKNDVALAQAVDAVTSQAEILRGRALVEKLVDDLGPDFFTSAPPNSPLLRQALELYGRARVRVVAFLVRAGLVEPDNPRYDLIRRIEKALVIYPVRQSQIIEVAFRWPTPQVPTRVVHTLIQLYLKKIGALDVQASSIGVFAQMTNSARARLEQDEEQLSQLKARYAVHDLDTERRLLMERISKLTVQLEGIGAPPVADGSSVPSRPGESTGSSLPPQTTSDDQVLSALREKVNNLRIEVAKLRTQFSPSYARMQEIEAQLASAEALMRREANAVRDSIDAYRRRLQILDLIDPDMRRVQRAIGIDLDTYQTYRKATEDRRMTSEQDSRVIVQVVDPPSTPYESVAPSRFLLLLAGVGAAPLLAFLFAALIDVVAPARQGRRPAIGGAVAREAVEGSD